MTGYDIYMVYNTRVRSFAENITIIVFVVMVSLFVGIIVFDPPTSVKDRQTGNKKKKPCVSAFYVPKITSSLFIQRKLKKLGYYCKFCGCVCLRVFACVHLVFGKFCKPQYTASASLSAYFPISFHLFRWPYYISAKC